MPLVFADVPPGVFDPIANIGYLSIDRDKSLDPQFESIITALSKKVSEQRELENRIAVEREIAPIEDEQ